jgi:hypothetical protein
MSQQDDDGGAALERAMTRENLAGELTVRERVLDTLLDKIRQDRYPSSTMMDDVEQLLTPWRRQDYADVLLEKVQESRYPSRSMIQRLLRLSG